MRIKTIMALVLAMTAACLTGCSAADASVNSGMPANTATGVKNPDKINIVCTIFPEYDWVREILGDQAEHAEITYLLNNGVDLHSFQPTADDIIRISSCDLFLYVGGESDGWVKDALVEAVNKDMQVINMIEVLGDAAKEEEVKEGMQGEEEEEEADGGTEYDEHVWLSLKNAKTLCTEIKNKLAAADPAHADAYQSNLDSYLGKLDKLDSDFRALADASSVKTLVFGDRFPFRYFVDDYGLDYDAAFAGCSAETEASFETIAFLADKLNELNADTVFTLENSDHAIAQTIISTSGREASIAELNSLQSVSREEISSGATYLSMMQKNCDVLAAALQ